MSVVSVKDHESGVSSEELGRLGGLGLDAEAAREAAAAGEKERITTMHLPPLALSPEGEAPQSEPARRPRLRNAGLTIATMVAVFFVVQRGKNPADVLTPKGGATVSVWWERGGQVLPVKPGTVLANGDRVRAEVKAATAGTAYWLVTDGSGKSLVSAEFVQRSAITLAADEKKAFERSVKLEGEAAGETLIVVVCEGAALEPRDVEGLAGSALPASCSAERFRLR